MSTLYSYLDVLPNILGTAQSVLGDRYAGTWITNVPVLGAVMNIGAVAPTPADELAIVQAAGAAAPYILVVPRKYSAQQLDAFDATAQRISDATPKTGIALIGPDPGTNAVSVMLGSDDLAVLQAIQAALPLDAIIPNLLPGALHASEARESRHTYPPYKGGRVIQISTAAGTVKGECTTGFDFVKAGLNQGSTAGHCGTNGDVARSGATLRQTVGTLNSDTIQGAVGIAPGDSALINLANPNDATNQIYINPTLTRSVNSFVLTALMVPGFVLCKTANTTGVTCGAVLPVSGPITDRNRPGVKIANLKCTSANADEGDSGAPVYLPTIVRPQPQASAAGILSLKLFVQKTIGGVTVDVPVGSCFDPIQNVQTTTHSFIRLG